MPEPNIDEQPLRQTRCPECGAEPTDESAVKHQLSNTGYLHHDQKFECSECGHRYAHGVPVGEFDRMDDATDLWCDVCELGYMSVHRVEQQQDTVKLHLKCGHHHPFDCPTCDGFIPSDGVRLRKDGGRECPGCKSYIPRSEVPYCYYFAFAYRATDGRKALVGYPELTGATEPADGALGYRIDDDGEIVHGVDGDG